MDKNELIKRLEDIEKKVPLSVVNRRIVFPLKYPKTTDKPTDKSSLKGSPKSSLKGSPKTEEKILILIAKDSSVTTKQIAGFLGITKRGVLKQIDKLKKLGKLERIGSARGGCWKLKK